MSAWLPEKWRILAKAHGERNRLEYEGEGEVDAQLLKDMIAVAGEVESLVAGLA